MAEKNFKYEPVKPDVTYLYSLYFQLTVSGKLNTVHRREHYMFSFMLLHNSINEVVISYRNELVLAMGNFISRLAWNSNIRVQINVTFNCYNIADDLINTTRVR